MVGVAICGLYDYIVSPSPSPFPLDFGFGTWIWDWTWAKQLTSFVSDFVSFIFYRTLIIMSITLALGIVKVSQILTQ